MLATSGEFGGRDLAGEGSLLPSRGSDPFVLILGGCRVEVGEPGVSGDRGHARLVTRLAGPGGSGFGVVSRDLATSGSEGPGLGLTWGLALSDIASSFSASICFSYSAQRRRISSSLSSLLRGRGGGEAGRGCLGGRGGGSLVTGARSLRARVLVGRPGAGLRASETGAAIWRSEDSEVSERVSTESAS